MRRQARRESCRAWIASGVTVTIKAHARRYGVDRYAAYPVPEHRRLREPIPGPGVTGGLEPSEEAQHVPRDDSDGTVVADDHVLDASTLRCRDRRRRLAQVVAAPAGDVAGQPPLDAGQGNCQAHDPQRQAHSLPYILYLAG